MEKYVFGTIALSTILLIVAAIDMHLSRVERRTRTIEYRLALLLRHSGLDPTTPSDQVRRLAADPGKKLRAIRLYCKETGADIKTAAAVIATLDSNNNTA